MSVLSGICWPWCLLESYTLKRFFFKKKKIKNSCQLKFWSEIPFDFSLSYPRLISARYLSTTLLILKGIFSLPSFCNIQNLSFPGGKSFEWWSPDTKTGGGTGGVEVFAAWCQAWETLFEARNLQKLLLHFSYRLSSCNSSANAMEEMIRHCAGS